MYNANFKDGKRLCEDRQISIEDLLSENKSPLLLCGDGAELVLKQALERGIDAKLAAADRRFIRAESVAYLTELLAEDQLVTPKELQPKYLRLPQAERERNEKEQRKGSNTL